MKEPSTPGYKQANCSGGWIIHSQVYGEGQESPIITLIGLIFVISSISFYGVGYWRFREDIHRIKGKKRKSGVSKKIMLTTTLSMILSGILCVLLLYQLFTTV